MTNAANTLYAVKRLIGRKFDAPEVEKMRTTVPFDICKAPNGDAHIRVLDRIYSPPEISAIVLQRLKLAAEEFLGDKHKDETFTFDGVKGVLEAQNEVLRSNDLTCVENMLLAQAHTLDMLFHKEARRAIAQQTVGQYKVHMDMAFKAQRQCRSTLEALAEIKNPRPYIQNNRAEYQQVNNGNAPSRADTVNGSRVREEKKLKSPNGLLEDKNDDDQWLDTRAPETAGRNDKKLEAVGASTGPKTEEGKESCKMNAQKHGAYNAGMKDMHRLLREQCDLLKGLF